MPSIPLISPDLLRRQTSGGGFLPVIDGLRFVAIGWVFVFHVAGWVAVRVYGVKGQLWNVPSSELGPLSPIASIASVGFFGVQLFFAISGFVLALPFCRARLDPYRSASSPRLGSYFLRRITRLEPPYVFNILFCAAWALASSGETLREVLASAAASLVYMHSLLMPEAKMLNSVAWSLEIEARFYVIAPALAAVFLLRRVVIRRVCITVGIVACCLLQDVYRAHLCYGHSIVNQGQYFLVGFLLADLYVARWATEPGSRAWDVLGIAAWIALVSFVVAAVRSDARSHGAAVHLIACAAMFFAYAGAFRGRVLSRFFSIPAIYVIGGMCYTIYLWHYLLIGAFGKVVADRLSTGILAVDVVAYSAAFAALSAPFLVLMFVMIERPCMDKDWPTKLWRIVRSAKAAAGRGSS
jgi:peptidoglycan/LPS O-acetylase OafA/YrhL